MLKKHALILHPFLFVLFPVLSLYAGNLGETPLTTIFRAAAVGLAGAGLLLGLLRLLVGDWQRAGALATAAILSFSVIGMVFRSWSGLKDVAPGLAEVLWGGLLVAATWLALRKLPAQADQITRILNITGWIALATCLYGFGAYGLHTLQVGEVRPVQAGVDPVPTATSTPVLPAATQPAFQGPDHQPPDIYYIILDGYDRSDVLEELFGVDNTPFIDFLKQRGFYVASLSRSNYDQTALSLASSLNENYMDALVSSPSESNNRGALTTLINDSTVQRFVKARGYRTVAFSNGFPTTEMTSADTFYRDPQALNSFEMTLISGSLARDEATPAILENYRQRILWNEARLEALVADQSDPRPKFVFAHFILPHPPFVFNADGSPHASFAGGDGSHYGGTREDYYHGYREQVQYTDRLAEQMIDAILAHSVRPPVIIIQGDHGSGMDLDWTSQADSCLRERFSILNAYYLPGVTTTGLYPAVTPVNTFRVVFNAYFDAGLPLLPDRNYFSLWETPYRWDDVTGQIETACPARRG